MNNFLKDHELRLEENDFYYRVSGCFWAQQYYLMEKKISTIKNDEDLSVKSAKRIFSKEIIQLIKNNHCHYKKISRKGYRHYLFYLEHVYVVINKKDGEITVKTEYLMPKEFHYNEYKRALCWIQSYLDIDQQPILGLHFYIQEKFVLNIGADTIASTSLLSLTQMVLDEKNLKYKIKQNPLWTEIYIENSDNHIYWLSIFHKAFNKNPALLLNQLSNLHEEYIKDEIECIRIDSYNFDKPENIAISLSK